MARSKNSAAQRQPNKGQQRAVANGAIQNPSSKEDQHTERKIVPLAGQELQIMDDWLDMEHVPEENGLAHAGYIVVLRGEAVRILYVGSVKNDDPGWLYVEVVKTLHEEPSGRRGWLPQRVVEGEPKRQAVPARTTETTPARPTASRSASTETTASDGQPPNAEAFPALRSNRQGSRLSRSTWWEQKRWGQADTGRPPDPVSLDNVDQEQVSAEDRSKAIERQRAAAKAAAQFGGTSQEKSRCPICADVYEDIPGKRRTRRPCCSSEICAKCDHKSLRSGKCYFCREGCGEFPSLGIACRVVT